MTLARVAAAAAVPALALALAATAWAAGPSLAGETFSQTAPLQVTRACDPEGTSTIAYSSTGIAAGPFAGTYTETGTVTVGPQNQVPLLPGSLITENAGTVLTFDADFTIDSPAGQVTGPKTLAVGASGNQAACVVAASALADVGFGPQTCTDVDNATAFLPALSYTATIQTLLGTTADSGGSTAQLSRFIANCQPTGQFDQSNFQETFFSTAPANTPGKATGSGIVFTPTMRVTFGFNAKSTGTSFSGACNVFDQMTQTRVRCLNVTGFVEAGNTVTITGNGQINGVPTGYRIVAQDVSEPNQGADTFTIETDTGYAAGGPVTGGNIQVS